ncbi:MFS transporter [Roseomonas sp. BN140053]|uniref:MFS transporter n=1 Tax=Roseomonas sp. BN140053 TaxID=3391898 RepID=UPI0039EA12A4
MPADGGIGAPRGLAGVSWVLALGTTLLMQTVAAFLSQCLPVLAPLLTGNAGLPPETAGHLAALSSLGTILFLLFGGPLLARLGPVRALQAGTLVAVLGLALAGLGSTLALVVSALVLGLGYGPTPPAGSRILTATAPARHRTLIFSIKQAGAPLGGMLVGLTVAPVAVRAGWPVALGLAMLLALLACLAVQPARRQMDVEREPGRRIGPGALFARSNISAPFAALRLHPLLPPLTWLTVSLATSQGCVFAFLVTWLCEVHALPLAQAGLVYAVAQGGGAFARIILGWLADRTGRPSLNLVAQGILAALLTAGLALLPVGTPFAWLLLLGGLAGAMVASWNGIYQAEIARLVPPARIAEATAGSTTLCFLGYVLSPALFALLVTSTGNWIVPQLLAAGQLIAVGLWVLPRILRAGREAPATGDMRDLAVSPLAGPER